METKALIRKRMLAFRDAMPPLERAEKSCRIARLVMGHPAYRSAECLLCYAGYKSEADTFFLMGQALKDGKKVYCPKVVEAAPAKRQMEFYRILSLEELEPGYHGIPEPPESGDRLFAEDGKTGLMILPGSVFDKNGNRIGYGGGYYDRYLGRHTGMVRMGICFDFQVAETVPAERYDWKMDLVMTENGIRFGG